MTATTPVRAATKAALTTALAAHATLSGVQVENGWPGKRLEREAVWVARVTGSITFPFMMAGRKIRDDEFTVTVLFMSGKPGTTLAESDARAEVLWSALDDILAADQTLSIDGVEWLLEGVTVEGPTGEYTDEGAVSFVSAEVSVKARYE